MTKPHLNFALLQNSKQRNSVHPSRFHDHGSDMAPLQSVRQSFQSTADARKHWTGAGSRSGTGTKTSVASMSLPARVRLNRRQAGSFRLVLPAVFNVATAGGDHRKSSYMPLTLGVYPCSSRMRPLAEAGTGVFPSRISCLSTSAP